MRSPPTLANVSLRVPAGVRSRLGQLLGHPQINLRLDQLEQAGALRDFELKRMSDGLGALDARLADQITQAMLTTLVAARDHSDRSVLEQQSHALKVAAEHTEATITAAQNQLVKDLREENRVSITDVHDTIAKVHGSIAQSIAESIAEICVSIAEVRGDNDRSISDLGNKWMPQLAVLRRRIDAIDARPVMEQPEVSDTTDADRPVRERPTPSVDSVISEEMYAALEDVFRGDEPSVKQRQEEYLPLVSGAVDDPT